MSLKGRNTDLIRHGEAVGIGMLCEIYYSEGESKNFKKKKNFGSYNLPINLLHLNLKKLLNVKNEIFKNIFLDKKKIGKYPRIIKLVKIGKSKIADMKNNKKIINTIDNVIFK